MSEPKKTVKKVALLLPLKTVSEANSRDHWRVKNRRKLAQQQEVNAEWKRELKGRRVALPCHVTFVRFAPRRLDDDNLRSAFKGIRDEVARLIGVDDGSPEIRFDYQQHRLGSSCGIGIVVESL